MVPTAWLAKRKKVSAAGSFHIALPRRTYGLIPELTPPGWRRQMVVQVPVFTIRTWTTIHP